MRLAVREDERPTPAPARRAPARRPARPRSRRAGGRDAARGRRARPARSRAPRGGASRATSSATRWRRCRCARQASVLRAFALYFQLANVAEQHHRVRRRRRVRARGARAARVARRARSQQLGDEPPQDVSLELVLTAHPTEAARRTVLAAHLRVARAARAARRPAARRERRRDRARRRDHDALAGGRGALAPAARRRRDPQRPLVLRAEPRRRGRAAARRVPAAASRRARAAPVRQLDRRRRGRQPADDGGDTIAEALDRARHAAARPLPGRGARARRRDRRLLAADAGRPASCSRRSPATSGSCAEYAAEIGDQNLDEPYRRKLAFVWRRLGRTRTRTTRFAEDLDVVDRSLRANRGARIADGALAALRRRVELFGFHLAKLEVRVHARERDRSGRARSRALLARPPRSTR